MPTLTEVTRWRRQEMTNRQISTLMEEGQGVVKAQRRPLTQRRVSRKASWRRWHSNQAFLVEEDQAGGQGGWRRKTVFLTDGRGESLVCLRRWIRCIVVEERTWRSQVTVDLLGQSGHHEALGSPGGILEGKWRPQISI